MTAHAMYQAPTPRPVLREAVPAAVRQQSDSSFVVDVGAAMRRVLVRAVAVLAMIAVALFLILTTTVQAGDTVRATESHIVGQGETLWVIAEDFTAPGGDVRATVADIRDLNGMSSSLVRVGQSLVVPTSD